MMNLPKKVCCSFALAVGLSSSASAQIAQERPELCGKENQPVPLPANVSAIQGDTGVFSTLLLKIAGSEVPIAIQLTMGRVEEVCPISKDRLLVVGDANPATSVAIVDEKVGKLMDWFYAYSPTVSPNQHWLVLQDFYPPQSEVRNSEEYLLYDLTKDKAGNLSPNLTPYTADTAGSVVYPVVDKNTPFEHRGLSEKQTHHFRADSFYWSDDSRMVLFADSVQKVLSIVMVTVDGDQTHAFVHKVSSTEACGQGSQADIAAGDLFLSHAEMTSSGIQLQFRSSDYGACKPVPMLLNRSDFIPAEAEVHEPPHRKDHSTLKQQ